MTGPERLEGAGRIRSDLASRWVGATVMGASDESFSEKERLLDTGPPAVSPGRYGPRGEIVDGWETRRRRHGQEPDWVIVRLGTPGVIHAIEIDTTGFTGNCPETAWADATGVEGYPGAGELVDPVTPWEPVLTPTALEPDRINIFEVTDQHRYTHVRLLVAPDGGVARLRVHGSVVVDPRDVDGLTFDLVGRRCGGGVVASSDDFYSSAQQLNLPDRARDMGEGWETRRRRDNGGPDWVVLRLGARGLIRRIVIDTAFYRYNASESVEVDAALTDGDGRSWQPVRCRTELRPDTWHEWPVDPPHGPVDLVRVRAYPDGGLSRVRMLGSLDGASRISVGYRWFNSLPDWQAEAVLAVERIDAATAARIVGARPLTPPAPVGSDAAAGALRALLEGRA